MNPQSGKTLSQYIADYRAAVAAGDSESAQLAEYSIRSLNEMVYWALLDEGVAKRQIERLRGIGQSSQHYETVLANASATITDEAITAESAPASRISDAEVTGLVGTVTNRHLMDCDWD